MLRISATYTVQRIIEVDGFDSIDEDGSEEKIEEASSAVVKELEGKGWKVNVESLESMDEFEDDEDEDDEDDDLEEDDEDESDEEDDEEEDDDVPDSA